jgi:hypothetical protein
VDMWQPFTSHRPLLTAVYVASDRILRPCEALLVDAQVKMQESRFQRAFCFWRLSRVLSEARQRSTRICN